MNKSDFLRRRETVSTKVEFPIHAEFPEIRIPEIVIPPIHVPQANVDVKVNVDTKGIEAAILVLEKKMDAILAALVPKKRNLRMNAKRDGNGMIMLDSITVTED